MANFTLVAAFKNPPTSGPATLPLKMVLVELVPNIVWSILSVSIAVPYSQQFPILISNTGMLELLFRVAKFLSPKLSLLPASTF